MCVRVKQINSYKYIPICLRTQSYLRVSSCQHRHLDINGCYLPRHYYNMFAVIKSSTAVLRESTYLLIITRIYSHTPGESIPSSRVNVCTHTCVSLHLEAYARAFVWLFFSLGYTVFKCKQRTLISREYITQL